ncbi:filamentous hemagglutinin N-terminal domain-containing protein [Nostoc sp. NMS8]|uniref:two-partner secretion domain-containing protein n=1 Tax=Nostoc sp. NMS8 TaxID=2815392 RepID=UPI0025FE0B7E|nr:filamentous hemagglutinin N-terminal domain-containing protein [Nostoc sp. NMS8]MBN3959379.1 filamentous hemagglutinin N-terminal domain-containing protein [Nostoc sp. NMS8]
MNKARYPQAVSIKSILHFCLISTALSQALPAKAQITPDNTLGAEASQLNQNLLINGALGDKIDGGATRGSNLFHSFSEFNIQDGQRVYFNNPTGVKNILTRVTGGNASNIFGTLGVDGAANLFLINPNGILFGENAQLDVQGSFVGTTANGVQFGNQGNFSATNPQAPPLLTVNPSALWFNQLNQGAGIQNNSIAPAGIDSSGFSRFGLRVPDGKSLVLVGGNVSIDGGWLNALGGRVELGGLAAPGNINLVFNGDNLSLKFPENLTRADVSIANQAFMFVEGSGGGDIAVNAQNVEILGGSALFAGIGARLGTPETVAGDITLNATGKIKIADSGSGIGNRVFPGAVGNGGNITINSVDFSLTDGARLVASTWGQGNAGNVTVRANDAISLTGNAYIFSTVEAGGVGEGGNIDINAATLSLTDGARLVASTFGQGNAGNVTVRANDAISLAANAYIFSTVEAGGVGEGGNIDINAATLSLTDGASLLTITRGASATQPAGRGDAGNVNVKVTGDVDISGEKNGFTSGIFSFVDMGTVGNGGNITIDSGDFSLTDGAQLLASTLGQGNAGNVTVRANNAISLKQQTAIFSTVEAGGVGKGGNIDITATSVSLTDGAQFVASTLGQGNAGNVTVRTNNAISLAANASILSSVERGGVGEGGNIDINAATLSLTDGASLLTITRGASATQPAGRGDAGNVNVKVTGDVDISGEKNGFTSGIFSSVETGTVGNGGNITIDSGDFSLTDGAQLSASTFGQGNAGNVTVRANDAISLAANAYIFSTVEAGGVGEGGNIDINAATLSLTDGASLLTITRGASATQPAGRGDAGNVNVKVTGDVDISGEKNGFTSGIFSSVETGTVGNGGNITIDSGFFSLRDGAQLATSTLGQGNAGNVTVRASDFVSLTGQKTAILTTVEVGGAGQGGNLDINAATLSLTDGAQLSASIFGQGNAGNVTVRANDAISLAANAYIFSTVEAGGVGEGGNIDINAATLSLTDGASLLTITRGASATQPAGRGDAGNVNVKVTGDVDISGEKNGFTSGIFSSVETGTVGNGGNITIDSGFFSLRDGTQLSASTSGGGDAGNIRVNAKDAVIVSGTSQEREFSSALFTFTDSTSTGKGGDITVNTNIFRVSDGALLDARTRNNQKGGDITVNAKIFEAPNGGQLTTTTSSNGRAGKITVNADDKLIISGIDSNYNDRNIKFPGRVGNIGANSGLFVSSTGSGIAGDIEINSPQITLDNQGKLNAESASGNGGNINANSDLLFLRRGAQISTDAGTEQKGGDGGDININSRFIVAIPDENSDISANAFTGTGGNIQINSQGIFGIEARTKPTQESDITASSELGVSGVTNINTPDNSSIQNSFTELPPNVIDTNALIANSCISRGTKRQENSFTITGSGALRNSPGDVLISAYTTGDVRSVEPTPRPWKKGDPIIEPQGLYRLPNGQLILSRSC